MKDVEANKERIRRNSSRRYWADREGNLAKQKLYRIRVADRLKGMRRRYYLKYWYGIIPEQADAILAAGCVLCAPGTVQSVVLDHNHVTGAVRGALCQRHNMGLGYFNDSPDEMQRAVEYLRGARR